MDNLRTQYCRFYWVLVLAPEQQIKRGIFAEQIRATNIRGKMQHCIEECQTDAERFQRLQSCLRLIAFNIHMSPSGNSDDLTDGCNLRATLS
jgi:hypothetical protein